MHRDSDRRKLFSRRTAILAGGKVALLSALVGRLYYLQVIESARYATLADENRINLRLLSPPRGRIVDRFGVATAINRQNYRVVLVSEQAGDLVEPTLDALGTIIDMGDGERRRILREIQRKRKFVPVTVSENLSWEEVARIAVNTPDLPGVSIDVGQSRYYPQGEWMAHILGYVAAVSGDEVTGDPLLELPGFRIGKVGIEKEYDLALRGTGGSSQVEINALGKVIRELERRDGQPGVEVTLTVDLELQKMVSRRLQGMSAAAVVMGVEDGDVLAMVSMPSFDPNAFNRGFGVEEWRILSTDPMAPLTNKAISGQYSPGSTIKMAIALAALENGVITPRTNFFCPGYLVLGDAKFHCWKRGGHGMLDLLGGITQSCDVYFYEVALRTGIDRIAEMSRRLGLGHKLGVDLPGEQPGLVPTRDWKAAVIGSPWQPGETALAGIGQGYMLTTPLQLAVMMARMVNGGYAVTPHLTRDAVSVSGSRPRPRQPAESLGISSQSLEFIRRATIAVVNHPLGTAYRSRIEEPGFEIGGKTGTVQVRRITKAEREQGIRKNDELPWKERDHAMFVGYGPVDRPRYSVAVVIEHGGGGASVAAPIARDILNFVQHRDPLSGNAGERVTATPPQGGQPAESGRG